VSGLSELKEKVQRILAANWRVELTENGFFVRGESTGCVISCFDSATEKNDDTYVWLDSLILKEVPITDEFLRYVCSEDMIFGNFTVTFSESGDTGRLHFSHKLLGNFLDSDELNLALAAVFFTADQIDDELQQRFGGYRAIDQID